jgi:exodeoxyribonuclease V beta subunit
MTITADDMKNFNVGEHWVIEANAGTGKTYTIENLVAHLIIYGKVRAEEILLVTFTIKAAAELRARVRDRLSEFLDTEGLTENFRSNIIGALALPDGLWNIQTIHGFCQRSLLEYSMFSGTSPNFRIVNEKELVQEVIDRALRVDWLKNPDSDIFKAIEQIRKAGVSLQDASDKLARAWLSGFRSPCLGALGLSGGHVIFDGLSAGDDKPDAISMNIFVEVGLGLLAPLIENYRFENGLMTFNSLILDLDKCLRSNTPSSDKLKDALRRKFRVCIVDEFQDTDALQWEIFKTLFCESGQHSFVCVGDPKQSIYGFRGADLKTYRAATNWICESKGAAKFGLTENWRSSSAMVDAVNAYLRSDLYEDLGNTSPSKAARKNVGIWEDAAKQRPVNPLKVMVMEKPEEGLAGQTRRSFSYQIAKEIHELMRLPPFVCIGNETEPRPLRYSDIMILTNSRQRIASGCASGDQVEVAEALAHFGIPHWVYRHEKLFLLPEVQSLLDVLIAALSPEEFELRNRAFLAPLISGRESKVWEPTHTESGEQPSAIRDAELFFRKVQKFMEGKQFNSLLSVCRERIASHSELPTRVKLNMEIALERLCEAATLEGLGAWQAASRLREWILAGDGADDEGTDGETSTLQIQGASNARNAVTLMTWHSSKGCEAPVVFVTGGFFNGATINFELNPRLGKNGAGEVAARFGKTYATTNKSLAYNDDEHRRLQYVVFTRASVLLYVPCVFVENTVNNSGPWHTANEALKRLVEKGTNVDCVEVTQLREFDEFPPVTHLGETAIALTDMKDATALDPSDIPDVLGIAMSSYSSLKKKAGLETFGNKQATVPVSEEPNGLDDESDDDETSSEPAEPIEDALDGLGGKDFGIFVHSLYEDIRWEELKSGPSSPAFQSELNRLIEKNALEIFNTFGGDAAVAIREALLASLTTPLCVPDVINMPLGIWQADNIVCEVNFYMPDVCVETPLPQERFFKGFIDVVFSHKGKTYFADWKTDRLEPQQWASRDALRASMEERGYELQLQLYSKALFRALNGTRNPERAYEAFGGGVYLFIRYGEGGVYARRPTLSELQAPLRIEVDQTAAVQNSISRVSDVSITRAQVNP